MKTELAEALATNVATMMNRAAAFTSEKRLPGYDAALENYSEVLWRWIEAATPDSTKELLATAKFQPVESAHDIALAKLEYMMHRCVFVEGLKHGRHHDPEWPRWYLGRLGLASVADKLGDLDLFKSVLARRKPTPGDHCAPMKFSILFCWLGGGLWCAARRDQQRDMIDSTGWVRSKPPPDERTLPKAQVDLGLAWRPAS